MEKVFENQSIYKSYFQLALPVVFSMVASMIYNLADTFFVSQTQNTDLIAGVSLCTPLFSLMLALGDIFGLGGSALISRLLGKKRYQESRQISSFCFYAAIAVGLATSLILLVFQRPTLTMLGAFGSNYRYAADFYQIMSIGAVFIIVSLIPGNVLRTEGLAKETMIATIVGTAITIVLDPFLIIGLHLNAYGAAFSTVLGYLISDIIFIYYIIHRSKNISINKKEVKITSASIKEVLLIGIPASITNLMQSFGTALINNSLKPYGTKAIAALGISLKIYLIVMLVMVGFAFGAQPLFGYNYGAGKFRKLFKIIRFDLIVVVISAMITAAMIALAAPLIVRTFIKDQTIIQESSTMLRILLTSTPLIGIILVFTTLFQSSGQALGAFAMSICRQGVILLIVLETFGKLFAYQGVIWSQPVADLLTCLIGSFFLSSFVKKIKNKTS